MILAVLFLSIQAEEPDSVQSSMFLAKLDKVIQSEESLEMEQERIQELREKRTEYIGSLNEIQKMKKKIILLKERLKQQNNTQYRKDKENNHNQSRAVYTIQTGSFLKVERAQKQFDIMLQALNKRERNCLRIERIGKFYSVRVGEFKSYNLAEKFLRTAKLHIPEGTILRAYIKDDRIVWIMKDTILSER